MTEERLKKNIAKNLSSLRKSAGLTQAELGEKLTYSDKSISKWERGDGLPDLLVLDKLAELYGVTVLKNKPKREAVREAMTKFNGNNNLKKRRYLILEKAKDDAALLSEVRILGNSALRSELLEILEDLDYTL